uniref:Uncharacterized protein n=1 Tax=Macaca fascicularis TaxID=9541 RepID=A0A7N9IDP9_MACFA
MMSEKTRQGKFTAAKKKLKEYWQRKSPGVPAGANRKKKINGSSPDTAASGGYRSPGDVSLGWPGSWGQRGLRGSRGKLLRLWMDCWALVKNSGLNPASIR